MIYSGDDILRLIPQRAPFIMVNTVEQRDENSAATTLVVEADNYFILPDGTMAESGIIEHIAQSCSALAGCQALAKNLTEPPVGIIGEVKNYVCHRRPRVGERLETTVQFTMTFGNVSIATGTCCVGEEPIAEVNLKIFIQ